MPIYAYICSVCFAETEELRKVEDRASPAECAKCGGVATFNDVNTGTTFSIKGAGVFHQGHPKYKTKNKGVGK